MLALDGLGWRTMAVPTAAKADLFHVRRLLLPVRLGGGTLQLHCHLSFSAPSCQLGCLGTGESTASISIHVYDANVCYYDVEHVERSFETDRLGFCLSEFGLTLGGKTYTVIPFSGLQEIIYHFPN